MKHPDEVGDPGHAGAPQVLSRQDGAAPAAHEFPAASRAKAHAMALGLARCEKAVEQGAWLPHEGSRTEADEAAGAVKIPGRRKGPASHADGSIEAALTLTAVAVLPIHARVMHGISRSKGPDAVGDVQHAGES